MQFYPAMVGVGLYIVIVTIGYIVMFIRCSNLQAKINNLEIDLELEQKKFIEADKFATTSHNRVIDLLKENCQLRTEMVAQNLRVQSISTIARDTINSILTIYKTKPSYVSSMEIDKGE